MKTIAFLVWASLAGSAIAQTDLRAWYADGQAWLLWRDAPRTLSTYRVFASESPFQGSVIGAERVGRVFREDWEAPRLAGALGAGASFRVPDGRGGSVERLPDEALFVYTPHEVRSLWFAVVPDGSNVVDASNSFGPILVGLDPVQCHLQAQGTDAASGQNFRLYAHWIDGRAEAEGERPDYPVMGNASFHGTPHLFWVWDPTTGTPSRPAPLVAALHGGGGAFFNWRPGNKPNVGLVFSEALLVAFDDPVTTVRANPLRVDSAVTFWLGYYEGHDRFSFPGAIPDGGRVVAYTQRRLNWALDWMVANEPVDPERISLVGHSMGAQGAGLWSRLRPDRFGAALLLTPGFQPPVSSLLLGQRSQNLPTSLPGSPGVTDALRPTTRFLKEDTPFWRVVLGRNDETDNAAWGPDKVQLFRDLDREARGAALYWDERSHMTSAWDFDHWNPSPRLDPEDMTTFLASASYPAFFFDDQDLAAPGRQPDPGDGDPADGDLVGTWGGHFDWVRDSVVDRADRWECEFFLIGRPDGPPDAFEGPGVKTRVRVAKAQRFQLEPGAAFTWVVTCVHGACAPQYGTGQADRDGGVFVRGLNVPAGEPLRLSLRRVRPAVPK